MCCFECEIFEMDYALIGLCYMKVNFSVAFIVSRFIPANQFIIMKINWKTSIVHSKQLLFNNNNKKIKITETEIAIMYYVGIDNGPAWNQICVTNLLIFRAYQFQLLYISHKVICILSFQLYILFPRIFSFRIIILLSCD